VDGKPRGWTSQYKVLTGVHSYHEPRYYKLDFAHCNLRLCVEIDGASHRFAGRKERDDQKDEFLRSQGWQVLRLTASVIRKDIDGALIAIAEFMRAADQSTKL
jgi:very-short-patch-repair endonuclease